MTPQPTGTIETRADGRHLSITRKLDHPLQDVWASLTESDRLQEWIGRWEGDPASGSITFYMTAEGDAEPELYRLTECDPPRRFAANTFQAGSSWFLYFTLTDDGAGTVLDFGMRINPDEDVAAIGPGWEYYLDRHAAALAGTDANSIVWEDYYPAMKPYYQALVG